MCNYINEILKMSFSRAPITRFNEISNKLSSANRPSPLQKEITTLQTFRYRPRVIPNSPRCSNSAEFSEHSDVIQISNISLTDLTNETSNCKEENVVKRDESIDESKKCENTHTTVKNKHMSSGSGLNSTRAHIIQDRNNRILESQFISKRKHFVALRKELIDKQKNTLQLYSNMMEIRAKLLNATGKDVGTIEEVKLLDLGQLRDLTMCESPEKEDNPLEKPQQHLLESAGENLHQSSTGDTLGSPSELVSLLEKKLHNIPVVYMNLVEEVVTKRNKLLVLINGLTDEDSGDGLSLEAEVRRQLIDYQQDADNFDRVLEKTQQQQMQIVLELINIVHNLQKIQVQAQTEIPPSDSLNEELKRKINTIMKEKRELQEELDHLTKKLTVEEDHNTVLKNETLILDAQMKKASQNVHDLENKLLESENTLKRLTNQLKEKECIINISKTDETSVEHMRELEKDHQSLEQRVSELIEARIQTETEATVVIMDLERQLEMANRRLNEETGLSERLHKDLGDVRERLFDIEQKFPISNKIVSTSDKATQAEDSKSNTELDTSQQEVELWTELQSTKVLLRAANNQLTTVQGEMKALEKSIQEHTEQKQIAEQRLQKIKTELEQKELDNNRLTKEANALTTIVNFNQEQFVRYERRVSELHAKMKAFRFSEEYQHHQQEQVLDLQSQIESLQTKIKEVESYSKQVEQSLVHRQLEVELRDRTIRKQIRALRTRDEQLVGIKSTLEQKQISIDTVKVELTSKNEELHSLYSTLEFKEDQVQRLEKLVKQLEQKQKSQLQLHRTNHKAHRANHLSRGHGVILVK